MCPASPSVSSELHGSMHYHALHYAFGTRSRQHGAAFAVAALFACSERAPLALLCMNLVAHLHKQTLPAAQLPGHVSSSFVGPWPRGHQHRVMSNRRMSRTRYNVQSAAVVSSAQPVRRRQLSSLAPGLRPGVHASLSKAIRRHPAARMQSKARQVEHAGTGSPVASARLPHEAVARVKDTPCGNSAKQCMWHCCLHASHSCTVTICYAQQMSFCT